MLQDVLLVPGLGEQHLVLSGQSQQVLGGLSGHGASILDVMLMTAVMLDQFFL